MRASFILNEIGIGLRRNLTMTIAVIITTGVSLGFFGTTVLVNRQVNVMKDFWYDKVEVSVFLCGQDSTAPSCAGGEVTQAQREQIGQDLRNTPEVERVYYESKQQAYTRFKEQFKDSAIAANVTADQMPESYRVKLRDPEKFAVVATAFAGRDGVEEVQDQKALLNKFFKALNFCAWLAFGLAIIMVVVALLLTVNTIRVSAFSRRRETGIMKLVGATNFSIQMPFLLEGIIAGLMGALLATSTLILVKSVLIDQILAPAFPFMRFIGWDAVWAGALFVVVLGVALAGMASFVTLRKYLRV